MPLGENPQIQAQGVASTPAQTAHDFITQQRSTPQELPRVRVPGGDFSVTASAERLFQTIAESRHIFYRGGMVVEIVSDPTNGLVIQVLDAAAAVSRFEEHVRFVKPGKGIGDSTPTTISEQTAKLYLKSTAARTRLPTLNGIVNYPLLVERDGQVIEVSPGYNEATRLYVTAAQPAANVLLEDAVEILPGLLRQYDFFSPSDHSRAIASIITPALKLGGFIRGPVPVDVAEADRSQSGKTIRQLAIAAIYNQQMAQVTKKSGGVGSMDETFNDRLVKGQAFIRSPRLFVLPLISGPFSVNLLFMFNLAGSTGVDSDPETKIWSPGKELMTRFSPPRLSQQSTGSPDTVGTTGIFKIEPGAVNSVPCRAYLEIDLRDTDIRSRDTALKQIEKATREICRRRKIQLKMSRLNVDPPAACHPGLVEMIFQICRAQKISCRKMISRAYHDSLFMARICPTTMIFIPSHKGYSHRPDEFSSPQQIKEGVRILMETLVAASKTRSRLRS